MSELINLALQEHSGLQLAGVKSKTLTCTSHCNQRSIT